LARRVTSLVQLLSPEKERNLYYLQSGKIKIKAWVLGRVLGKAKGYYKLPQSILLRFQQLPFSPDPPSSSTIGRIAHRV